MSCCYCRQPIQNEAAWYGLHSTCFKKCFKIQELAPFSDLVARSQSQTPQLNSKNYHISFFHGAYKKYSGRLVDQSYILKVQQKEFPELPATEFLCNQIFESLNVPIPEYSLIQFPETHLCFATKNFMAELMNADLVHIYHFIKESKDYTCEQLIQVIGDQTGRRTEQEKFAFLTLADSLIGNNDRHGRNLAFIRSPKGMILAPFYDNPSSLAIEDVFMLEADLRPRGSIFTRNSDKPTMKDYIQEWERLGYSEIVGQFRKQCSLPKIEILIQKSYLSEKRKQALIRLIKKRYEELCTT